ncbi:MAG: GNAT family N-acetyltransferase [Chloroflexi bacterium]|nr:GNAT family N-acetyltransferase [Chloroflexota bacterium]
MPDEHNRDMIVPLLALPPSEPVTARAAAAGVAIRRAKPWELSLVRTFIEQHFTPAWADEVQCAWARVPLGAFIAIADSEIVGIAAYGSAHPEVFGPTGVRPDLRGNGVGAVLLLRCLADMRALGYLYAIIGAVGPAAFYERTCGAMLLPDVWPSYVDSDTGPGSSRQASTAGTAVTSVDTDEPYRPVDMLVPLLALPDDAEAANRTHGAGVVVRRAQTGERTQLRHFVTEHFNQTWAHGVAYGLGRVPSSVFVALDGGEYIGFAAHSTGRPLIFGPMGMREDRRGSGVGGALLLRCLADMRERGHIYAVIGWAGPVTFYSKTCGALGLPANWPGLASDSAAS